MSRAGTRLLTRGGHVEGARARAVVVTGCTDGAKRGPTDPTGGGGGKVDDPASTNGTMRELHGHHHDGDRTGLHGMELFGRITTSSSTSRCSGAA
jgi:hypothetical protein